MNIRQNALFVVLQIIFSNDIYKDNKFQENLEVSSKSGSIQNITYSKKFDKIYVTDSLGYVYILNSSDYKRLDKFKMNSIVKSLDVNEDEDIVMGDRKSVV